MKTNTMASKVISIVILVAALGSMCQELEATPTKSTSSTGQQDGETKDYQGCIGQLAEYLAEAKQYITKQVEERVQDSIKYYGVTIDPNYVVPAAPEGCDKIVDRVQNMWGLDCFFVVNSSEVGSGRQSIIDMISANKDVKDVLEAFYSCQGGRQAGELLDQNHILDLFKPKSAKKFKFIRKLAQKMKFSRN